MLRFFSIFSFLILSVGAWGHEGPRTTPKHNSHYFIENKGQWEPSILLKAEIPQGHVLITKQGIVYQLVSKGPSEGVAAKGPSNNPHLGSATRKIKGQTLCVTFPNGHFATRVVKENALATNFQFLKGKEEKNWVTDAKAFKKIDFLNVFKGIDLVLYFHEGLLKYDFIIHPGANPKDIQLQYDGADSLSTSEEHLVLHTSLGKVYEKPPFSYQINGTQKKEVKCHFHLEGTTVHFDLGKGYDATKKLIIDPELLFTTYSGSLADNWGNTATYDNAGNFYSGGVVFGDAVLPVTPGRFEMFQGGNTDVFVLKYTPDGSTLLFAAYLGGSNSEIPISFIVNKKNELVVLGITGSSDFPTTTGAFDSTFNGGNWIDAFYDFTGSPLQGFVGEFEFDRGTDIFVSVINTVANTLSASTYLGGSANDGIILSRTSPVKNYGDQLRGEVIVDTANNIYIASHTYSSSLEGLSPAQPASSGLDAIMVKFDPSLSSVSLVHRLGGGGHESGFGIRLDSGGDIFMTGSTSSTSLFSAPGLHTSSQGSTDGYILKLSGGAALPLNATYLGTPDQDQCYFIDIDYNDHVYVFGLTNGNYPVTPNVYSNVDGGQFIHKLTNDLGSTLFSTRFGSGKKNRSTGKIMPDISPTAFMVNDCRKIFLSGWGGNVNPAQERWNDPFGGSPFTYTTGYYGGDLHGLPTTRDAFQSTTNGTGFYFMIFQPEAKTLGYATFFGGTDGNREHVDGGTSRFDKRGIIYQSVCAGCGGLSNLPGPTPNVWSQTNNSSNCNNAAIKFDLGKVVAKFETFDSLKAIPSIYGCTPITFLLKNKSSGATNYKWLIGNKEFDVYDSLYVNFTTRGKYDLTLIAFDTSICRLVDTARAVINAGDVRADFPKDRINCGTQPFTADVKLYTPWAKVKWEPTTGLSDPTIANPVVSPTSDMQYVITIQDDTLCIKSDTFNIKVRNTSPLAKFQVLDSLKLAEKYTFCYPSTGFFRSLSSGYDSLWWNENPGLGVFNIEVDSFYYTFSNLGKTNYKLSVYDTACKKLSEDEKVVILSYPYVNFPSDIKACPDSAVAVSVSGEPSNTYVWTPSHLFPDPNASDQILDMDTAARIYIHVTDSIGCQVNGSFLYGLYGLVDPIAENEAKLCPKKVPGINIQSVELKEYNWVPGDSKSNTLYVTNEGKQYLFGKTLDGCPVRDSVWIVHRCDPEIHVPDAFTPDGDGRNDFFQVFGHEITAFDIKIFNRWGEIIYHSTDFRFQWDGTYRNQTVPIGTYPYIITYGGTTFEGDRIRKSLSGDITVVK